VDPKASRQATLESGHDLREGHAERTSRETPIARSVEAPPLVAARASGAPRMEDDGVIARGGMGEIHKVYDRNIHRYAAMKVLDAELAEHAQARRRFLAEAQITGQLEHPNIVPVYDLELTEQGAPRAFTMKLVDGQTLTDVLRSQPVAARTDAQQWDLLNVFLKVCDAVAYAHSRGVLHRDLKPDNVMIGPYGQVYVMDWGIARIIGSAVSEPPPASGDAAILGAPSVAEPVRVDVDTYDEGSIVGTYQYMAPEQAWGRTKDMDARTDVFALGGILYHVLTGQAPYHGSRTALTVELARAALVAPPAEVVKGVTLSPALCAIAMKALAQDREDRYPTVNALKRDVERALRGGLSLGTVVFPSGTVILQEGDAADAAYIVTRGRCEAYKTVSGEKRRLREMGPGDVFGEMALLSSPSQPRSASVAALEDVTAILVTPEVLAREVHAESWLLPLLRTLVERFRELEQRRGP
jgi:serine/threonine protein kinase